MSMRITLLAIGFIWAGVAAQLYNIYLGMKQ